MSKDSNAFAVVRTNLVNAALALKALAAHEIV
jgi:hypothetical protein